jgi:hypothetical protein
MADFFRCLTNCVTIYTTTDQSKEHNPIWWWDAKYLPLSLLIAMKGNKNWKFINLSVQCQVAYYRLMSIIIYCLSFTERFSAIFNSNYESLNIHKRFFRNKLQNTILIHLYYLEYCMLCSFLLLFRYFKSPIILRLTTMCNILETMCHVFASVGGSLVSRTRRNGRWTVE